MDWNENKAEGSMRYSPNISAEKIIETSTYSFFQLCRTKEGREIARKIIDNKIDNE